MRRYETKKRRRRRRRMRDSRPSANQGNEGLGLVRVENRGGGRITKRASRQSFLLVYWRWTFFFRFHCVRPCTSKSYPIHSIKCFPIIQMRWILRRVIASVFIFSVRAKSSQRNSIYSITLISRRWMAELLPPNQK